MGNAVKLPAVVMRPMAFPLKAVNQRLPSGPAVMNRGSPKACGTGKPVKLPAVVMRPMSVPAVNQRLPSGPVVMLIGSPLPVGVGDSVIVPALAQAGALLRLNRPTQAIRAVSRAVRCDRQREWFMFLSPSI